MRHVVNLRAPSRRKTRIAASRMSSRMRRDRVCRGFRRALSCTVLTKRLPANANTQREDFLVLYAAMSQHSEHSEMSIGTPSTVQASEPASDTQDTITITRVVNTCVLLEFPGDAVLTDPYFVRHWF